jgi:hypothetical protein
VPSNSALITVRGDAAELLEFGEAAFHEMALGIEMFVEWIFECT